MGGIIERTAVKFVFLYIVLTSTGSAIAHEYVLDKVEPQARLYPPVVQEVCGAYVQNLNKFDEPMVCERKIYPGMKDFSKPIWTPIDVDKHPELIEELARFGVWRDEKAKRIKTEKEKEEKYQYRLKHLWNSVKKKYMKLYVSEFDVDNDGEVDRILRRKYTTEKLLCDPVKQFGTPIHGWDMILEKGEGYSIDKERSVDLVRSSRDIFQYKGTTFFDHWRGKPNGKEAMITVYYPTRGKRFHADGQVEKTDRMGIDWICWIKYTNGTNRGN